MLSTFPVVWLILYAIAVQPAASQGLSQAASPAAGEIFGVHAVLEMKQAGLSEDIIVARIRQEGTPIKLTTSEMVALKKAGLTDAVIAALMNPTASTTKIGVAIPGMPKATENTDNVGDTNNPDNPHASGIYLYTTDRNGKPQMVLLERAAYQGTKTGILGYALTSGIKKAKTRAVIPGPRASIRSSDPRPVFYFYFEEKAGGLGRSGFGSTMSNPNQFALLRLEVKKSNRETVVGEFGITGASAGTDAKSMIPFKSERLRDGTYRVIPTAAMEAGEYCFLASILGTGSAGAVEIFDFGISVQ
jgi:hypothetical protein